MKLSQTNFSNRTHFFNFRELRRFRAYVFTKTRSYKLQDVSVYSIFRNGESFTPQERRQFNQYKTAKTAKDTDLYSIKLQIFSTKRSKKIFKLSSFKSFQIYLQTTSLCRQIYYGTKHANIFEPKLLVSNKINPNEIIKINEMRKTVIATYERIHAFSTYEDANQKYNRTSYS